MNYLQSERNYTILNSISRILKQNGLEGTESLSLLAEKTVNKTGWTSVLLDGYDNRFLPVYTSELITRINTAHHQEMTEVNSTRKKLIDHLEKAISLRKKHLHDSCTEMKQKHTYVIRSIAGYETAITNHLDQAEIVRLHSHKQSLGVS